MTQPKSESATSAPKRTLSEASLRAMRGTFRRRGTRSFALRERAPRSAARAPRSCGTGRTRRRPARAGPCRRDAPAPPPARRPPASRRSARAGAPPLRSADSIVSAASPIVSTMRARRADERAQRSRSRRACRGRRGSGATVPSAKPSSDFAAASTLVPLESSIQRTPLGLGDELGAVRQARRTASARRRSRPRERPSALGRGHGRERVLEVVRPGQRQAVRGNDLVPRRRRVRDEHARLEPHAPLVRPPRAVPGARRARAAPASARPRAKRDRRR